MLDAERFYELVRANNGFEVTLGFRDDVDHFIGGKGNKIWYFIRKRSMDDFYICTLDENGSKDVHYTRKKKILSSEPAPAGKTMEMILARLSTGQEEIEKDGRRPAATEVYGHACSHYSFAFGERAYKISDEYGITVSYSNIKDEEAGFSLRNLETGEVVKAPVEK